MGARERGGDEGKECACVCVREREAEGEREEGEDPQGEERGTAVNRKQGEKDR